VEVSGELKLVSGLLIDIEPNDAPLENELIDEPDIMVPPHVLFIDEEIGPLPITGELADKPDIPPKLLEIRPGLNPG